MLTWEHLNFPSHCSLFFERRLGVCQRLDERSEIRRSLKVMGLALHAVNFICCFVLGTSKSSSLHSNRQFCYLNFVLDILLSHDDIDEQGVLVVVGVPVSVGGAKPIEAFHADIQTSFVHLN